MYHVTQTIHNICVQPRRKDIRPSLQRDVGTWQRWQGLCCSCEHDASGSHDPVLQGLGKGGAKRHRKILRDNIQGITKPASSSLLVDE